MVNCFTCGKPNATFKDRQLIFMTMINGAYCKDCFRESIKELNEILATRPKTKAILNRIFGVPA